jgi:hypothetical protein
MRNSSPHLLRNPGLQSSQSFARCSLVSLLCPMQGVAGHRPFRTLGIGPKSTNVRSSTASKKINSLSVKDRWPVSMLASTDGWMFQPCLRNRIKNCTCDQPRSIRNFWRSGPKILSLPGGNPGDARRAICPSLTTTTPTRAQAFLSILGWTE